MTAATIDIHAHILTEDTIAILQRETKAVAPRLTPIDEDSAVIEVAGKAYKPFPRGAWDLERRVSDMQRFGFDMQVVAVCPQTFLYGQEGALTLAVAQIQNDQIAALAAAHPDTFAGLATVPMQAPELAAQELRRAMGKPGICGAMIGSHVNGKTLDDPALEPLWEAANETRAFILVHPMNAVGVPGIDSYYLKNLIGNPLDTTVAAACLVFGGVLDRYPQISFCMCHGGGFTPYQSGRFVHGWKVRPEPKQRLANSPQASLDRLLYDTILHDREPLAFLLRQVGARRVFLGSDYPFDMGQYDTVELVRSLPISEADKDLVLGAGARELLGLNAEAPKAAKSA